MKRTLLLFLLAILFTTCQQAPVLDYTAQITGTFDHAAIAGPHPLATEVGLQVLQSGGNAIDAAVAVKFAMAVVYPRAGNIGGGGFLVYRDAAGKTDALDYRERAPAAASRDMYLDENDDVIPGLSTKGHLAIGVPGAVAGIEAMHQKYGSKPWAELVQYAIDLAANGYRLSATEVGRIKRYHEDFLALNHSDMPFADSTVVEGSLIKQTDLAATLTRIQAQGKAGFYTGETADISMPPSSSGGICLAQMAEMLEPYPLADYGFQSVQSAHLTAESPSILYSMTFI